MSGMVGHRDGGIVDDGTCGLPTDDGVTRYMSITSGRKADLGGATRWQAAARLPVCHPSA